MELIQQVIHQTILHHQVYKRTGPLMRVQEILYMITQGIIIMGLLLAIRSGLPILHLALQIHQPTHTTDLFQDMKHISTLRGVGATDLQTSEFLSISRANQMQRE